MRIVGAISLVCANLAIILNFVGDMQYRKKVEDLESRKITICTTCQSEFYSEDLVDYTKNCVNCPMSDEEFKKLIDDVTNVE